MKYVLFDLDGTLLPLDTEHFVQEYLKLLSQTMKDDFEPSHFISRILKATEAMILNLEDKTNEEVFIEYFFTDNENVEMTIKKFEIFYMNEFKKLKIHSKPNPYVQDILKYLKSKKIDVVIATNPIFPLIAIEERIRWIGIDSFDFKLITSYENMKFCKPQLQYYQQILDEINANPGDCLMVGNDIQEDIIASKLGMKTFLVEDYLIDNKRYYFEPTYKGSFLDLKNFIKKFV